MPPMMVADQSQALQAADLEGVQHRHLVHRFHPCTARAFQVARAVLAPVPSFHPQDDQAPDDECQRHRHRVEQVSLHHLAEHEAQQRGGQESHR
jgi:hypothetical protein